MSLPRMFHGFIMEYERGKFDFTGKTDPSRDLIAFLKLLKKRKFWVIIRPGPYIYSECPNDGVPDYAYKYHRLHPKFLAYAATYIKKVCAVFKEYQANAVDPFHFLAANAIPLFVHEVHQEKAQSQRNLQEEIIVSPYLEHEALRQ